MGLGPAKSLSILGRGLQKHLTVNAKEELKLSLGQPAHRLDKVHIALSALMLLEHRIGLLCSWICVERSSTI